MDKKLDLKGKLLALANYKAKPGKEDELMKLVQRHLPTLRELGLATNKTNYIARSSDGRIIEVFEWASPEAVSAAHQHPAIADIWEKMTLVSDFLPLNTLTEANQPFVSFETIE